MSYNIDSVDVLKLDAWIDAKDLKRLRKQCEDDLAECNVLDEHCEDDPDSEGRIKLRDFEWYGEGSGRSFRDTFLKKIAPKIHGTIEAILCWEGGDSISGLLVKDGKAVECDVVQKLDRPKGW